jgi:hypothetical protein
VRNALLHKPLQEMAKSVKRVAKALSTMQISSNASAQLKENWTTLEHHLHVQNVLMEHGEDPKRSLSMSVKHAKVADRNMTRILHQTHRSSVCVIKLNCGKVHLTNSISRKEMFACQTEKLGHLKIIKISKLIMILCLLHQLCWTNCMSNLHTSAKRKVSSKTARPLQTYVLCNFTNLVR